MLIPGQVIYIHHFIIFNADNNSLFIDGNYKKIESEMYIHQKKVHIPLREVLTDLGYQVSFDKSANSIILSKNDSKAVLNIGSTTINVNGKLVACDSAPFDLYDTTYISTNIFEKATELPVQVISNGLDKYVNRMDDVSIDDSARIPITGSFGGILIAGNRAMETIPLPDSGRLEYAQIINQISRKLPNCNVYNMLIPTGAEYYADRKYSILNSVDDVNHKLDDSIIPVNAFGFLNAHKSENIYFRTDHHWTQRGAYYAYQAFLDCTNRAIDPIDTFESESKPGFIGSMSNFLKGSRYLQDIISSPETIEYFKPKVTTKAEAYSNMGMTENMHNIAVVSPSGGYQGFISGDNPLTMIETSINTDKKLLIVKESYGNALATWAVNNYKKVCVVDPRLFNGSSKDHNNRFNIIDFCNNVKINDVLFINYPGGVASPDFRKGLYNLLN